MLEVIAACSLVTALVGQPGAYGIRFPTGSVKEQRVYLWWGRHSCLCANSSECRTFLPRRADSPKSQQFEAGKICLPRLLPKACPEVWSRTFALPKSMGLIRLRLHNNPKPIRPGRAVDVLNFADLVCELPLAKVAMLGRTYLGLFVLRGM